MKAPNQFAMSALSIFLVLVGCANPATFQAAGTHGGKKYTIEVVRGTETFNPSLSVLLNGDEAILVKKVNMFKDQNCKKTAISSWRCRYTSNYKGMELVVIEEVNTNLANNSLNYDVYLDGDYVQRVVASIY